MRRIIIDNTEVEIETDEVVEFIRKSNLLEFETLTGGFSITFKVPYKYSAINQLIFQFSGTSTRKARGVLSLPFEFWWRGELRYVGTVQATEIGEYVECSATIENGGLNEAAKSSYLDKMNLGSFSLESPTAYYTSDVVMPKMLNLIGTLFSGREWVNTWDGVDYAQTGATRFDDSRICPMWRWGALLSKVLSNLGYAVMQNDIPDWAIFVNFRDVRNYDRTIPSSILCNKLVPHITVDKFILQTQNTFNVVVDIKGAKAFVRWRNTAVNYSNVKAITLRDVQPTLSRESWTYGYTPDPSDRAYTGEANSFAGHNFLPWVDAFATDKVTYYPILGEGATAPTTEWLEANGIPDSIILDVQLQYYRLQLNSSNDPEFLFLSQSGAQQQSSSSISGFVLYSGREMLIADKCIRTEVLPIGYHAKWLEFRQQMAVPPAGKRYLGDTFTQMRWGRLVDNGTQHEVRAVEDYTANPSTGWILWAPSGSGLDTIWAEWWADTLAWLNENAEYFEAVLAEDSPDYFLNVHDTMNVYEREDGTRVILTEITEAYSGTRLGSVKVKGYTIR